MDVGDKFPHFVRLRGLPPPGGLTIGPFESGQSAERFIHVIEDAFDLCRDYTCLRQAPNGSPCPYLQMGRCAGPCNGTISLEEYRQIVARAGEFAAGRRKEFAESFQTRMKQASAALEFEKASTLKTRIERLEEFNSPPYRHVAPLEQFRFVLVQPISPKRADAFLAVGPGVAKAGTIHLPPAEAQLGPLISTLNELAGKEPAPIDEAGIWRMGLVAHYLFSGPQRAGAILRWQPDLAAADLRAATEQLHHRGIEIAEQQPEKKE